MQIAPNEKFGCFAYSGFTFDGLSSEMQLGPRLWWAPSLGFEVEKYWKSWLGEIKTKAMKDINFVLYTTLPSQTPNVTDGENIAVIKTLDYVVYGLLLQGAPDFSQGFSFHGASRWPGRGTRVRGPQAVRHELRAADLPAWSDGAESRRCARRPRTARQRGRPRLAAPARRLGGTLGWKPPA
jgi:hypothetical protein